MNLSVEERKNKLRREIVELRQEYSRSEFAQSGDASEALGKFLVSLLDTIQISPKICASYINFGSEVDPSLVEAYCSDWNWVYPKVVGETLEFYQPNSRASVVKNEWGICEPDPARSQRVCLDQCAAVLVPGRAFDREGNRLGSGRGYYDRALSSFNGVKIGVGYSVQVVEERLPIDHFDVALDFVVTEKFILEFGVSKF